MLAFSFNQTLRSMVPFMRMIRVDSRNQIIVECVYSILNTEHINILTNNHGPVEETSGPKNEPWSRT